MQNLKQSRRGFRYEHVISTDGAKRNVIIFEVSYLKSLGGAKGVRVSMRPTEIEQGDGYTTESVLLYNEANISAWAKMLARKSDKEVEKIAEALDSKVPLIIAAYLEDPAKGKAALQQAISELEAA